MYALPVFGESVLKATSEELATLTGNAEPIAYACWSSNPVGNPLTRWNQAEKRPEPIKMKIVGGGDGVFGLPSLRRRAAWLAGKEIAPMGGIKVEGPTDLLAIETAGCLRMGDALVFSTASGAGQFNEWHAKLYEGLDEVIVVGDHDRAGQAGVQKAAGSIANFVPSVVSVNPFAGEEIAAKHGQDLRDYFAAGRTINDFDALPPSEKFAAVPFGTRSQVDNEGLAGGEDTAADDSSEAGDDAPEGDGEPAPLEVNEAVDDPHRLARLYIENCASHDGALAIRRHREDWKKWNGRDYRTVTQEELQADLCRFIKEDFDRFNLAQLEAFNARDPQAEDFDKKAKPPQAIRVTRYLVSNTLAALQAYCTLDSSRDPPFWTIDNPPHPAHEMASTESGLIHIPSLADGGTPWRFDSTPDFFSPNSIGVKFKDDDYIQTRSPQRWLDFLDSIFGDAPDQIELLREWMGYCLLPDTSQQKILLLIGQKRSGKGTICRVLTQLVGVLNVVNPRLSSFATDFGLEQLIGKTVAIITDARLSGRVDISQIAEVLLSISGEDRVTIARKYKVDLSCRLPVRFMILSNELPMIADSSGAFASRCLLLHTNQSFFGREDRNLEADLLKELPGIFVWAAQGWQQLRDRGHFEPPESTAAMVGEMKAISSPISEFIRECCELEPGYFTKVGDLFDAWKKWCEQHGVRPGDRGVFGRNLLAAAPKVKSTQPRDSGDKRYRGYEGISLKPTTPT